MTLYQELDIVTEIKKARLRWVAHVEMMSEDRIIEKLYMSKPEGRRSVGRPKVRWLDVEEGLRKMRITGWREKEGSEKRRMEICLEEGQGSSRTAAPYGTGTVLPSAHSCVSRSFCSVYTVTVSLVLHV
jgi:hypothetical protein